MSGFQPPPPGAMPPGVGSPDMADELQDMMASGSPQGGAHAAPGSNAVSSMLKGHGAQSTKQAPLGGPVQEAKHIAGGVKDHLFDFLPPALKSILGENPNDNPEEAERKRQMLQNYNKLTADEQQFVQKKLQEEEIEKRKKEEEEQHRRQVAAAQSSDDVVVPEGKKTGEAAMGGGKSKKSQTISKLQNDRKKMTSAG